MGEIQRGLVPLLEDLDRRARPGRPSRNRPIQKYVSVTDSVTISSEVVAATQQTPPYQFTKESYRSAVMADSPTGYWRFNEHWPSTAANDEAGAGIYVGTYTTSARRGTTGPGLSEPGWSVTFSGSSNSYISIGNATGLNIREDLSVEAWVSISSTAASQSVITRGRLGTTQLQYAMLVEAQTARFYVGNGVALTFAGASSVSFLTTETWYHLAGTYTSSSGVRLYVNAGTASTSTSLVTGPLLSETTGPRIGSAPSSVSFLTGPIDEVAVYASVLSTSRISAHYTAMTSPASPTLPLIWGQGQYKGMRYRTEVMRDGPAAYWRLGENAPAGTANDEAGGGAYTGTIGASVSLGATGAIVADPDRAMTFADTTTADIQITSSTGLNITGSVTVEAWVRPDSTKAFAAVVSRGNTATTGIQYYLTVEGLVPKFFVGNGVTAINATGGALTTGTWNHLVGRYASSSGVSIVVNGTITTGATLAGPLLSETTGPLIGRAGGSTFGWVGAIDEVAIYNSALSTERLYEHYLAGTISS